MLTSCCKLSTKSSWLPLADLLADISCFCEIFVRIFDTSSALTNLDYAPVDVDGVNRIRAELGDLTVLVHPVLLVDEGTSGVGGKAAPITNADKVSCEAVQLELSLTLLIGMNPGLTQVDDVGLEEGGVDPQVCHVWTQPGNVECCHPDLANHNLVPVSRVLIEGSKNCNI